MPPQLLNSITTPRGLENLQSPGIDQTTTYDASGNPLRYYNGKSYTFTWAEGRRLATATVNGSTISYAYDMDGLRVSKTVGGVKHTYIYASGRLLRETWGTNTLDFFYDQNGRPYALKYNGATYYYITNFQGDVLSLINANGTTFATYTYDPYGKVLTATGAMAEINPLRYRGYYYDTETSLYCLQSRYYDSGIGRFINADSLISTGQGILGYNMFAYCLNNPTNMVDSAGNIPKWVQGVINFVSGTLQAAAGVTLAATVGWTGIGGAAASFLVINGTTTMSQGVGQIVNDITDSTIFREDNILETGVEYVGEVIGGEMGAEIAGAIYDTAEIFSYAYAMKASISGNSRACFIAGTPVKTSNGEKVIEAVKAGDYVWAWDEESQAIALKRVVETYENKTDELVHVFVNGEEIVCTPSHPFYSPVKGWTDAVHLHAGDILVLVNGEYVVVEKVQHEILEAPVMVYNFQVEDYHTYYVSNSGVLVHNMCAQKADIRQLNKAAKEAGIPPEFRHAFGDYVEASKWGYPKSFTYPYAELLRLAKEFLEEVSK